MRAKLRGPRLQSLLAAAAVLAGCTLRDALPGAPPEGSAPQVAAGLAVPLQAEVGMLSIRIRWPVRDLPGFKAQIIPLSTRSIRLTIRTMAGVEADRRLLPRLGGESEAVASIYLAPADGYTVIAEAFATADPADLAAPIALGTAANVPIRKGKITHVPITLTAAFAPAITGLDPGTGGFGSQVRISGTNFGASLGLDFVVTFAGIRAEATRFSDTQAVAAVPVGPSGNVVLIVDGVPSTSVAPFAVTDGILSSLLESIDVFEHTGLLVEVQPAGDPPAPPGSRDGGLTTSLESTAGGPAPAGPATSAMEVILQ